MSRPRPEVDEEELEELTKDRMLCFLERNRMDVKDAFKEAVKELAKEELIRRWEFEHR